MNIIVDLNTPITDGKEVVFRSPVDCSLVTGLLVNHAGGSQEFAFADAHGNNVGDIDHLFAENAVVKVILDVTTSMAFVQNADTNAYLEGRFDGIIDKLCSNFTESASVVVCEPVEGYPLGVVSKIEPAQQGQSAVHLRRCGKNLFDISGIVGTTVKAKTGEGTLTCGEDGGVTGSGTPEMAFGFNYKIRNMLPTDGKMVFSCSGNFQNISCVLTFYDANGTSLGNRPISDVYPITLVDLSNYANYDYIQVDIKRRANNIEMSGTAYFQLELGVSTSDATSYEPYCGEAFTIDLGRTVYGGSFDWGSGVLTETHGADGEQLEEPVSTQLTSQKINAVSGTNILYSSTGDTDVTGKADPTAIINKLTQAIISLGGNV